MPEQKQNRSSLLHEIVLPNGRKTSNFGFGCASLLRMASRRHRRNLIARAFDGGIRHFDVARMYGLGAAEQELGAGLGANRQHATIATKFGFPMKGTTPFKTTVQSLGRYAIGKLKSLRKGVKKGFSSPPRDYSIAGLRESLETSLAQLGIEHIDLLFYHEPRQLEDLPAETTDQLKAYCHEGKVGGIGISTFLDEASSLSPVIEMVPEFRWQLGLHKPVDIFHRLPEFKADVFGLFGLIGGFAEPCYQRLQKAPVKISEWSDRLGLNLRNFEDFSISTMVAASVCYPETIILFSTTNPTRLERTLEFIHRSPTRPEEFKEYAGYLASLSSDKVPS